MVREGKVVTRLMLPAVAHLRPSADRRRRGGPLPQPGHRLPGGSRPAASGRSLRRTDRWTRSTVKRCWAATLGCEVVLLVATDVEAGPVCAPALRGRRRVHWSPPRRVLVGELAPLEPRRRRGRRVDAGWRLAVSGCDKVNAAHLLTCLLQAMDPGPRLVLQVGIAGALARRWASSPPAVGGRCRHRHPGGLLRHRQLEPRRLAVGRGSSGWPIAVVDGVESGGVFPLDGRLVAAALEVVASAATRQDESAVRGHQARAASPGARRALRDRFAGHRAGGRGRGAGRALGGAGRIHGRGRGGARLRALRRAVPGGPGHQQPGGRPGPGALAGAAGGGRGRVGGAGHRGRRWTACLSPSVEPAPTAGRG